MFIGAELVHNGSDHERNSKTVVRRAGFFEFVEHHIHLDGIAFTETRAGPFKDAASAKFEIEFGCIKHTRRMHASGDFRSYELANDAANLIAEFHDI